VPGTAAAFARHDLRAQVVYNPDSDVAAYIGGSFTEVAIAPGQEAR
jgi:hypothetical protein